MSVVFAWCGVYECYLVSWSKIGGRNNFIIYF